MLRIKPNLNLVDNDCFIGFDVVCDYRSDMTFEELIDALMYGRYGKVAYDPTNYTVDEQYMIRKMAERSFTSLIEFPSSQVPFGSLNSIVVNPNGVQHINYVPKYPESVADDDYDFDDFPEPEEDLCWKDSHTAMDKSGRMHHNLNNSESSIEDITLGELTGMLQQLLEK